MTTTFIMPDEIDGDRVLTKYHQIYTQLKKELVFKNYKPGERFYSLRVLCGKYGVDMQTIQSAVDLLLNDGLLYKKPASGIYVNEKTKRSHTLAMGNVWFAQLGEEWNNPYYDGLRTALQTVASRHRLNAIFSRTSNLTEFKTWFQPETGDGLILTGQMDAKIFKYLEQINFSRYSVVGNYELPAGVPNVHTNIKDAVFKALEIASEKNKRKLAIIAGVENRIATQDILSGVKNAEAAGLIEYVDGFFDFSEDGHVAMHKLAKNKFDCVLATEAAFFGLCRYIFEHHIKCPDELFVIRYGNNTGYNYYSDITGLSMTANKETIMEKVFEMLFCNGPRKAEVDIKLV